LEVTPKTWNHRPKQRELGTPRPGQQKPWGGIVTAYLAVPRDQRKRNKPARSPFNIQLWGMSNSLVETKQGLGDTEKRGRGKWESKEVGWSVT
jgi:hypothetical protein